jgi:hypothetical protein
MDTGSKLPAGLIGTLRRELQKVEDPVRAYMKSAMRYHRTPVALRRKTCKLIHCDRSPADGFEEITSDSGAAGAW